MKLAKRQKGFTLIELLVVLAIIGILIGLAIAGIRIVQQVNRDTQRKAFLRDIQLLLEAHHEKKNKYPTTIDIDEDGGGDCAEGETLITTKSGTESIEKGCSKVNFDVEMEDCDSLDGKEEDQGTLTMCYEGESKGFKLVVLVERSDDPYDASNVELD